MDRWVENPPQTYIMKIPVWIRLHKIPVNYFTLDTMGAVADAIRQVKEIVYDLEKLVLFWMCRTQ